MFAVRAVCTPFVRHMPPLCPHLLPYAGACARPYYCCAAVLGRRAVRVRAALPLPWCAAAAARAGRTPARTY